MLTDRAASPSAWTLCRVRPGLSQRRIRDCDSFLPYRPSHRTRKLWFYLKPNKATNLVYLPQLVSIRPISNFKLMFSIHVLRQVLKCLINTFEISCVAFLTDTCGISRSLRSYECWILQTIVLTNCFNSIARMSYPGHCSCSTPLQATRQS